MYRVYFLLIILYFGFPIEAGHFRGGTISWKPMNNNITAGGIVSVMITQTYSWTMSQVGCNDSMIATQSPPINLGTRAGSGIDLMCNASCSTSGGYVGHEVPITGYCTDYSTALNLTVSQRSDIVNLTVGAHFTVTFATNGGWQILALGNSSGWSLSSLIDLSARSDNGLINTPPVATCISYISVPLNIQQTIQIPVLDADNDFIRCRFANGSSECVNTCPPGSLPPGTSLSSSCTLTITGPIVGAYYLVAIQVEDFITNTSTTPLSSVPLQFLVYVYASPNCTLQPLLVSDLQNDTCQGVQTGINFSMTLTAINRCGNGRTMDDIATLSFPVIIKSALIQNVTNTSLWSMKITWIPTANEVGSQVFCAIASDSANVQSDQYCVTFFVGLNSVPLCPGATAAPTTMMTTDITSHVSTEAITTMDTTFSSIIQTSSSSLSSSTVQSNNTINWPLIMGLSLAALVLAVCCALCCCYYYLKSIAYRQRRRKNKTSDNNIPWRQLNANSYLKLSKQLSADQHYQRKLTSKIIRINTSSIINDINIAKINQREKSSFDYQRILTSKSSSTIVRKNCQQDEIPQSLTLDTISSNLQNSLALSSASISTTATKRRKSVDVKTSSRFAKVSIRRINRIGTS